MGEIRLIGNEVTPDRVILDQLETLPGGCFTGKELRNAQRRLARLGLFDSVRVTTADEVPGSPLKTIVVSVQERPDANVRLKLAACLRFLEGWRFGGLPVAVFSEGGRFAASLFGLSNNLLRSRITISPPPSRP
jgi:hypothetical protein